MWKAFELLVFIIEEHIRLEYDGTVRDPHGHIVQFLYGEDGIDVAKSDHGEAFNIDRLIEFIKYIIFRKDKINWLLILRRIR